MKSIRLLDIGDCQHCTGRRFACDVVDGKYDGSYCICPFCGFPCTNHDSIEQVKQKLIGEKKEKAIKKLHKTMEEFLRHF